MTTLRNRISGKGRWLWPAITAVAVAIAVMSVIAAQSGDGEGDRDRDGRRGHDNDCAQMAELVGVSDCAALKAAMADGQSLAEVAAANGVEQQAVIDGIVAAIGAELDEAVADGKLTAAQADEYRGEIAEKVAAWVYRSPDERYSGGDRDRHHGPRGHAGLDAEDCDSMAELVGSDCQTLMESLASGDTLAEIAERNGVEPQTVIDTLVERMSEELDAKVASGDLTEAKATALRERLSERIAGLVNEGFERAERGHGKRGGAGGLW